MNESSQNCTNQQLGGNKTFMKGIQEWQEF